MNNRSITMLTALYSYAATSYVMNVLYKLGKRASKKCESQAGSAIHKIKSNYTCTEK